MCRNVNNQSELGICMFSIDCMHNKGVALSICKHNHFVGICCRLSDHDKFVGFGNNFRDTAYNYPMDFDKISQQSLAFSRSSTFRDSIESSSASSHLIVDSQQSQLRDMNFVPASPKRDGKYVISSDSLFKPKVDLKITGTSQVAQLGVLTATIENNKLESARNANNEPEFLLNNQPLAADLLQQSYNASANMAPKLTLGDPIDIPRSLFELSKNQYKHAEPTTSPSQLMTLIFVAQRTGSNNAGLSSSNAEPTWPNRRTSHLEQELALQSASPSDLVNLISSRVSLIQTTTPFTINTLSTALVPNLLQSPQLKYTSSSVAPKITYRSNSSSSHLSDYNWPNTHSSNPEATTLVRQQQTSTQIQQSTNNISNNSSNYPNQQNTLVSQSQF